MFGFLIRATNLVDHLMIRFADGDEREGECDVRVPQAQWPVGRRRAAPGLGAVSELAVSAAGSALLDSLRRAAGRERVQFAPRV